ncbi:hypothetical protein GQ457_02G036710 [Hibiscus cannabinus]
MKDMCLACNLGFEHMIFQSNHADVIQLLQFSSPYSLYAQVRFVSTFISKLSSSSRSVGDFPPFKESYLICLEPKEETKEL